QKIVAALEAHGLAPRIDTRDFQGSRIGGESRSALFVRPTPSRSSSARTCLFRPSARRRLCRSPHSPIRLRRLSSSSSWATAFLELLPRLTTCFSTRRMILKQGPTNSRALQTDLAWLKEHTRVGELARRWTSETGQEA